ncbi:MAG: hypothetical protein JSW11_00510 [Candidatus Heimdallarchaeota archaeon]|nr:MAG: hypothetical protein JSW11_00510 [Candidatus Heimdallarchaeota archaeon]
MKYTRIAYRTNKSHRSYASIPHLWLSDFLDWLELSDAEVITTVSVGEQPLSAFSAPSDWPSYRNCELYTRTVFLVKER